MQRMSTPSIHPNFLFPAPACLLPAGCVGGGGAGGGPNELIGAGTAAGLSPLSTESVAVAPLPALPLLPMLPPSVPPTLLADITRGMEGGTGAGGIGGGMALRCDRRQEPLNRGWWVWGRGF